MAAFGNAGMALVEGRARFADLVNFRRGSAGSLVASAGAEHVEFVRDVSE